MDTPSHSLPNSLACLPQWCLHKNKVPSVKTNARKAFPFDAVSEHGDIGLILSPDTTVAAIDVDFLGTKKEQEATRQKAIDAGFAKPETWSTKEYVAWLKENTSLFSSVKDANLLSFMTETYTEFSPSGLGLHIFLTLTDKDQTDRACLKSNLANFKGQLSIQNCFMTVTRAPVPGCADNLKSASIVDFEGIFGRPIDLTSSEPKNAITEDLKAFIFVSKERVKEALDSCPCDPSDKVCTRWKEVTGKELERYDYWLSIGMALHSWGTANSLLTDAYILWLEWSQKDVVKFKSEEDVIEHWRSFSLQDGGITIATLLAMESGLKFAYPRPILTKEGKKTINPITNEYVNFEYLIKYYKIELYEDGLFFLTGEEETMQKYFSKNSFPILGKYYGPYTQKELEAFTLILCQESNWRRLDTTVTHVKTWMAVATKPLDLFKSWIDTPFNNLPENLQKICTETGIFPAQTFDNNSTIEYLFECLNVQAKGKFERDLYFTLFKKFMMQVIKFREPEILNLPFVDNGGMLILTGAENTYKSTFCKLLVPNALDMVRKEINSPITGEKNIRDFLRYFASKAFVQVDEFEAIMDINSPFFKNLLSNNDPSFVDIYATQEHKRPRKAVIIGTTNKERLVLSPEGTRRLWFIPVGKIDTTAALKVNLHKLYNDLRVEFRSEFQQGRMPWLLSQEEINYLNFLNQDRAALSDLDIILEEVFPIDGETMPENYLDNIDAARDKGPKTLSSMQVRAILTVHGYDRIKPAALDHALERHCGKWTDTLGGKSLSLGVRMVKKGKLLQGWVEERQRYNYARWVMPPQKEE